MTTQPARGDVYVQRTQDGLYTENREVADGVVLDVTEDGEMAGVEVLAAVEVTIDGRPVVEHRVVVHDLVLAVEGDFDQAVMPHADPLGTLRLADGDHLFIKLAQPADEPWHFVFSLGDQRWDGWQSNDDMQGTVRVTHIPVELAFPETPVAEIDAVARALHAFGTMREPCAGGHHGWGHHYAQARAALLAAPRRATISHEQYNLVVSEFSHACPHCPPDKAEWVVHVKDLSEIITRVSGQDIEPENEES